MILNLAGGPARFHARPDGAARDGRRCRLSTWDAASQGGWARHDDPLRLQSEDEAATRYSGAFPFFTKSVELSGNALGACWRDDDLIVALDSGAIVSDEKTLAASAPVTQVHALLARGDVVARVSNDSIAAWRAGSLVDEVSQLAPAAVAVRALLRKAGLNDAYTGGLPSYAVLLMLYYATLNGDEPRSARKKPVDALADASWVQACVEINQ
mgnify:CR=1 FL=1